MTRKRKRAEPETMYYRASATVLHTEQCTKLRQMLSSKVNANFRLVTIDDQHCEHIMMMTDECRGKDFFGRVFANNFRFAEPSAQHFGQ